MASEEYFSPEKVHVEGRRAADQRPYFRGESRIDDFVGIHEQYPGMLVGDIMKTKIALTTVVVKFANSHANNWKGFRDFDRFIVAVRVEHHYVI